MTSFSCSIVLNHEEKKNLDLFRIILKIEFHLNFAIITKVCTVAIINSFQVFRT